MKYGYATQFHSDVVTVGYYSNMGIWTVVDCFDSVEEALVLVRKLNK